MAEKEDKQPANAGRALVGEGKENNLVLDHYFGTAEKTEMVSSYVQQTYYKPYNPDDLYQKTGDHSIYEEMNKDDQVNVCLQLKKDLVIGGGWNIVSDDDAQMDIVDDITSRLEEDPDEAIDDDLDVFLDNAYTFGFVVAEKLFQKRQDNSLTFKSLRTRHPDSWLLHTNDAGHIERFEQRQSKTAKDIPANALIHYTPSRSTVGPYGVSDLRKVYSPYFVKRHITRFYSIFLEKAASPIPISKYDLNTPDDKVTELHNIIKTFQTKTALTIPKSMEIDFLESKSNGEAFTKGINLFNMFIARGLFIPDLLGLSGSESSSGGSQALGREQVEIFLKHIARRRRSLERLVNRHIIQPMIVYNHGFMENYPKFQFKPITEEDTKEYARIFLEAVKGKFYKVTEEEVQHFKSLIKFPESEVELIEGGDAGSVNPPPPGMPPNGPIEQVSELTKEEKANMSPDELKAHEDKLQKQKEMQKQSDMNAMGEGEQKPGEHNPKDKVEKENFAIRGKAYKTPEGDFHKRCNFQAIQNELDSAEQTLVAELRPLIEEVLEDMYEQFRKKKVMQNPERIGQIKLKKLSTMNKSIKKALRESYKRQGSLAMAELYKTEFRQPLPSDEFLSVLDEETFAFIGDWEYQISRNARIALVNGIKEGLPLSAVIDMIDEDTKKQAIVSLERYSRTKFTEVMNRARLEQFDNSRVVDAYQYSAIMDGRTSEICAGLHGKIFKKGTEPIPPLHFNCRSTLIPITVFEDYTVSTEAGGRVEVKDPKTQEFITRTIPKQPIDQFIEENIGDKFGRR